MLGFLIAQVWIPPTTQMYQPSLNVPPGQWGAPSTLQPQRPGNLIQPGRSESYTSPPTSSQDETEGGQFGAMAYSYDADILGSSWGANSRQTAANEAIKRCGRSDCKIVLRVMNGFGAYAQSDDAMGTGYGSTQLEAKQMAIQQCRQVANIPSTCRATTLFDSKNGLLQP
jgi:Domain of unknown function (DUF4189)